MPSEKISLHNRIEIFPSPLEADLAILPIFAHGSPGYPNEYVLTLYGYRNEFPEISLEDGFGLVQEEGRRPLLYIVTDDGKLSTGELIETNLLRALLKHASLLDGKKIWLPLIGIETQSLPLNESFRLIALSLNLFVHRSPSSAFFIISIPDTADGNAFYAEIQNETRRKPPDIPGFLDMFNIQVFLVGSNWQGDEQLDRFLQERIWEKGHPDDTYADIIWTIKEGDILINKSSFRTRDGEQILRLKAIGDVTMRSEDGASVSVDWKMTDIRLDIPGYGGHNKTIEAISTAEAAAILSHLNHIQQQQFVDSLFSDRSHLSTTSPRPTNNSHLAGLANDSDRGADYLDITRDVDAFARVITARAFEPPLAIALFGKWGSGKSFFMRKLKEKVAELSASGRARIYCEGVVQIHFNAWSYMDANLWASFVSRIFEGLNEYVSQNTASQQFKKEIEKELGANLQITRDEIQTLEEEKQAVQRQLHALQQQLKIAKGNLDHNLNALKRKILGTALQAIDAQFHASEKILTACRENKSFIETEAQLESIIPAEILNNPTEAYRRISSTASFIRECCRWRSIWGNIAFLLICLTLFVLVPPGLKFLTDHLGHLNFTILQPLLTALIPLGYILRQILSAYHRMKPVVGAFWKIKQDYEHKRSLATEQFQQQEKALKLQIEKDSGLLISLTAELQKAQSLKSNLEFKIDNILATEALYAFIEKRSASDDYKKHLGIISIIRKDLEILNGLFTDHHGEIDRLNVARFRSKFTKPLQRIILYIDDLDRCPEETVIEVLEAVNLLMAFPLFVVVVGVDPRWIKNALIKRHFFQFTGYLADSSHGLPEIELVEASDYLEKIFQIPFHLKTAPLPTIRGMVRQVALNNQPPLSDEDAEIVEELTNRDFETEVSESEPTIAKAVPPSSKPGVAADSTQSIEKIQPLQLSDKEIQMLEDLAEVVGPNPRALKRFVNIYRLIKVHEDFSSISDTAEEEELAVLFLLALSIGCYKTVVPTFEKFIEVVDNSDKTLDLFLQTILNRSEVGAPLPQAEALYITLSNNETYFKLKQTRAAVFARHNQFIKRFTFSQ